MERRRALGFTRSREEEKEEEEEGKRQLGVL